MKKKFFWQSDLHWIFTFFILDDIILMFLKIMANIFCKQRINFV